MINAKVQALTTGKVWLAPMAGISDIPFRRICKELGAQVMVSEMVSADGLMFKNKRTTNYMDFAEYERPFGIQLFGSDPVVMAKATEKALLRNPDFIDINMGCPVRKVVNRGAGSALMQEPLKAAKIVSAMRSVINGALPLGVKFRSGWDSQYINCLEFGKRMQDAGADIMCLHPRTRAQKYAGLSNWQLIADLRQQVQIPVIGSGDIDTDEKAIEMMQSTNCHSIMIGRGAIGAPWIFAEVERLFLTGKPNRLSLLERLDVIKRHLQYAIEFFGEERAVVEMRPHFSKYTRGLTGGAEVRNTIMRYTDPQQIMELVTKLYEQHA